MTAFAALLLLCI